MECLDDRRLALLARFPEWRQQSLPALFDAVAAAHPERPAILGATMAWSYRALHDASQGLAASLLAQGLEPGDRIAVVMANHPEFVAIKLAIARIGCIAVPINFELRREEMLYAFEQAGCTAVFAMAEFRGRSYLADLDDALARLPPLRLVVVRASEGPLPPTMVSLERFVSQANPLSLAAVDARQRKVAGTDIADIVYTSGTTGRPKGAMLSHDMLLRSAFSSALTRGFEDGRRIQFALPMYHVFGYVECWIAVLFVGGAIIPHTQFEPAQMLDLGRRSGTTDMVCVPVMTCALIEAVRQGARPAASLHAFFNSGGVNPPTIWGQIRDTLGVSEIHTAYGMTETTASTMCTRTDDEFDHLIDTNGRYKLAGPAGDPDIGGRIAEYRVVDPVTGATLPDGTDGELQVRGPVVTRGYFRKPDETAEAFTADGWFRTGDVGRLLEGGFLKLTGRIKEAYRCGGEMVMPREIEALLEDLPGIAQVLVVGVPDEKMGEAGCLCIVPAPAATLDEDALRQYCRENLARFKVPKHILRFRAEDIPVTATGRAQKFRLAQIAKVRLGLGQG